MSRLITRTVTDGKYNCPFCGEFASQRDSILFGGTYLNKMYVDFVKLFCSCGREYIMVCKSDSETRDYQFSIMDVNDIVE